MTLELKKKWLENGNFLHREKTLQSELSFFNKSGLNLLIFKTKFEKKNWQKIHFLSKELLGFENFEDLFFDFLDQNLSTVLDLSFDFLDQNLVCFDCAWPMAWIFRPKLGTFQHCVWLQLRKISVENLHLLELQNRKVSRAPRPGPLFKGLLLEQPNRYLKHQL